MATKPLTTSTKIANLAKVKQQRIEKIEAELNVQLTALLTKRKEELFNILSKLKADFPEVFAEEPKPLAIGIGLELKKLLNGQFPNNQLNRFFYRYCGSFKYKEKLVEGARRYNLDGSPATLVTAKEVPVMVSRPRFNKKSRDASDTVLTGRNEIERQHNE